MFFSACRLAISIAEGACTIDANRTRSFGYGKTAIKLGIRAFSEGSDLTQGFEKRLAWRLLLPLVAVFYMAD
jgi:hypothetical protein